MPGILDIVAPRGLNIKDGVKPVRQKKRLYLAEKQQFVDVELDKLLAAGFIKEL